MYRETLIQCDSPGPTFRARACVYIGVYVCIHTRVCVRACGRRDYRVRVCPRDTYAAGGRPHVHAYASARADVRARECVGGHGRPALSRDIQELGGESGLLK